MSKSKRRADQESHVRGNSTLILLILACIYLVSGNNLQTTFGKIDTVLASVNSGQVNQSNVLAFVQQLTDSNNPSTTNSRQSSIFANVIPPTPIPTPTPIPLNPAPAIVGDAQFVADWSQAFQILQTRAPHYWNYVSGKVITVKQNPNLQHDWVNTDSGIFEVGRDVLVQGGTREQILNYMACALPHEACHVDRARQAKAHGVQFLAGALEELTCFPIQAQCLDVLGSPDLANGVRNQDGTHVYRYRQDDFPTR